MVLNLPGCHMCFFGFDDMGYLLIIYKKLINGIGSKLGYEKRCSLGGGVGDDSFVCTLGGCKNLSTLRAGAGMTVIYGG